MSLFSVFLLAQSAVEIANSVSEIRKNNSERAAANAKAAAYSAQAVAQSKPQNAVNKYDVDLFYAKVAMLSYIAKSDNLISLEEKQEFYQTLEVAGNMYGYEAIAKARQIFDNEGSSFTVLEQYLRKVQERDLDAFIFYADEYTKIDRKLASEEQNALQKLRSYIDTRKGKKSFQDLTCPSCGAVLHPDSYGYKAVCGHCGYEIVLNTEIPTGKKYSLLMNATPVGMFPKTDACPVPDEIIENSSAVFDVIYNPRKTQLIKKAEALGKKASGGMAMLVYQAVSAHEIWDNDSYDEKDIAKLISDMEDMVEKKFS